LDELMAVARDRGPDELRLILNICKMIGEHTDKIRKV
jgi:hypothetical protein